MADYCNTTPHSAIIKPRLGYDRGSNPCCFWTWTIWRNALCLCL